MMVTLLVIEEAGASNYQQQKSIYLLEDKLMNNLTKVVSNWPSGFGEEDYKWITPFLTPLHPLFLLCTSEQPSNEHSYQDWVQLAQWFQRRRLKCKSLQTRMAN